MIEVSLFHPGVISQVYTSLLQQLVKYLLFVIQGGAWCLDVLEESYMIVVSLLQPDVICQVYTSLLQQLVKYL